MQIEIMCLLTRLDARTYINCSARRCSRSTEEGHLYRILHCFCIRSGGLAGWVQAEIVPGLSDDVVVVVIIYPTILIVNIYKQQKQQCLWEN